MFSRHLAGTTLLALTVGVQSAASESDVHTPWVLGERFVPAPSAAIDSVRHAIESASELNGVAEVVLADRSQLAVSLAGASRRLPAIFAALASSGAEVRETTLTEPSLESLFISLTGKELRE